jgi:hypothetical protein
MSAKAPPSENQAADWIYLDSPRVDPPDLRTAPGGGLPCDQCGQIIEPSQVEYLLEPSGEDPSVRLHVHCLGSWRESHPQG